MSASTVAAIATARGEAALAIVRMTGPRARTIGASVFLGAEPLDSVPSHTAWFGRIVDSGGREIDEVVATVFVAPRSATGEDIVEFTCHGGHQAPSALLQCLLDAGADPAPPGEFSRRSFVNGKMDLQQAEAVIDLIQSRSEAAHRASVRQLRGRLKERLDDLRADLLELTGLVELELDFGEEDVEFADRTQITGLLDRLRSAIADLRATASHSRKWREGVDVVIAGRPNAGKSTLLNALVGSDRAIVSETPGTTRDFVDVELSLDGLLVRVTDTAGMRATEDAVEQEGVRRAESRSREADVVLYVFDSEVGLLKEEEDFLSRISGDCLVLRIANKSDLGGQARLGSGDISFSALNARLDAARVEELLRELKARLPAGLLDFEGSAGMVNERHLRHLDTASRAIDAAERLIVAGAGGEILSLELRAALEALGSITGEITNEDILGEIFGRFCIGK